MEGSKIEVYPIIKPFPQKAQLSTSEDIDGNYEGDDAGHQANPFCQAFYSLGDKQTNGPSQQGQNCGIKE